MILLSAQSIYKRYGPEPVLAGVTFDVRPGERIGLIGPNGTGKTTLLKILAGLEEADAGVVERHPSCRVELLEQHPEFPPGQTVWQVAQQGLSELLEKARHAEWLAQQIAEETDPQQRKRLAARFDHLQHELAIHGGYQVEHKIARVLHGLGFGDETFSQDVAELSGGQKNRLLLARLLLAEPELMLLDEPSNHLDLAATTWLEQTLAQSDQAVLVVSHDRYFLDAVTNRTLELYQGTVESYSGNFSAYWRQKEERLLVQQRTYDKQQLEIAKAEDFIRRNHYGQKHAQAEDRRKKLERIERVPPPRRIAAAPMRFPPASRCGDVALRVENLAKAYERPLFSNLSFDILRGERWGVMGPNASGKTTLLRCVLGEVRPDAGRVALAAGTRVGYLDQLTAGLDQELPAVEAVRPPGKELNEPQRRDLLARFGVTGDSVFQKVRSLSGGERSRAGLARLAGMDVNFLILDEPTNHLDLWARDALEEALRNFDGTVLLVSHDRYFLNRVVHKLLVVEGGCFRVIHGNYEDYLAFQRQAVPAPARSAGGRGEVAAAGANGSPPSERASTVPAKRKRKFPYRKLTDLEADILARETELEELHAALARPENLRSGEKVRSLQARLEVVQAELARLYEHWEEAVELN